MKLALFRSTKDPDVFGFTADPAGSNLPAALGPWQQADAGSLGVGLEGLAMFDPVIQAVERDGFFLARSGLTISAVPEIRNIH
jgi:hypothetical protein